MEYFLYGACEAKLLIDEVQIMEERIDELTVANEADEAAVDEI